MSLSPNDLLLPLDRQPWLATGLSLLFALAVAYVVYRLGRRVLRRIVSPFAKLRGFLAHIEQPLGAILMLLGMHAALNNADDSLRAIDAVRHLSSLLLLAAFTWLAVQAIRGGSAAVIGSYPIDIADNLDARKIHTQTRVISQILISLAGLLGFSFMLMSFPQIRQIGLSLLASAGVLGLAAGMAARPVLANLISGLQLALTQPIRLDDVVIVENEWGRIEEITSTYVVVRIWDDRRMIVPLQWFVEHPFQNWTRTNAQITGSVFLWVDYRMPVAVLRGELERLCAASALWDGRLALLQVTEAGERAMQVRAIVSSVDSSANWDLRCLIREQLIAFMQAQHADCLPATRIELSEARPGTGSADDSTHGG